MKAPDEREGHIPIKESSRKLKSLRREIQRGRASIEAGQATAKEIIVKARAQKLYK